MYEALMDLCDRSFYTDKLYELTGKPRSYWIRFSLWRLKQIYAGEIRRKETHAP